MKKPRQLEDMARSMHQTRFASRYKYYYDTETLKSYEEHNNKLMRSNIQTEEEECSVLTPIRSNLQPIYERSKTKRSRVSN